MQLVTAMFCTSFASCCTGSYWYQSNHHGATLASYSNYGHIYLSIYFYNPYLRQRWHSALGKSILHDSIMLLKDQRESVIVTKRRKTRDRQTEGLDGSCCCYHQYQHYLFLTSLLLVLKTLIFLFIIIISWTL